MALTTSPHAVIYIFLIKKKTCRSSVKKQMKWLREIITKFGFG